MKLTKATQAQLERFETATRTARDNAARAAQLSEEIGAHDVALDLKRIAALYDALLADVLRDLGKLPAKPPADDDAGG